MGQWSCGAHYCHAKVIIAPYTFPSIKVSACKRLTTTHNGFFTGDWHPWNFLLISSGLSPICIHLNRSGVEVHEENNKSAGLMTASDQHLAFLYAKPPKQPQRVFMRKETTGKTLSMEQGPTAHWISFSRGVPLHQRRISAHITKTGERLHQSNASREESVLSTP